MTDLLDIPYVAAEDAFSIDPEDAERMQLHWIQQRYDDLRPRIRVLDTVASDVGISRIEKLEDVVPLCLPHTIYKSYSIRSVQEGRWDRLTTWLDGLTTEDLSGLDVSGASSLESWLDIVEAGTRLQPLVSSGTSGKVSFFPRTTVEMGILLRATLQTFAGYRDEADTGLASGDADMFSPLPMATGRQTLPRVFALFRDHCYGGDGSRIHTRGQGHWDADMLWLSGRLRAAAARGEEIALAPETVAVAERVKAIQADAVRENEQFLHDLMVGQRGKRVVLFAPTFTLYDLAAECERRGMDSDFAPGTCIITGGGNKGAELPDGWEAVVERVFPFWQLTMYSMTETIASCRKCAAGWYHYPPTIVLFVIDPDTSEPLPRSGMQTGRLAIFDVCAETYWGGAITGDKVTVDWETACPCGRKGPRIKDDVTRYSNLRDDDRITCAKSPGAYERAVDALTETV
jgi:hypothetical protein